MKDIPSNETILISYDWRLPLRPSAIGRSSVNYCDWVAEFYRYFTSYRLRTITTLRLSPVHTSNSIKTKAENTMATSNLTLENSYNLATIQKNISITEELSSRINLSLGIDRLFICVKHGEQAVSILRRLGLYCPNTIVRSKSQGTLSQIFFFENMYVAIIWLENESLQKNTPVNFAARVNWQKTHTSPFGIGLSKKQDIYKLDSEEYPVDDLAISNYIAYSQQNQKNTSEPIIFMIPDRLKYCNILNQELPQNKRYVNHPLGVKKITDLKILLQSGKRRQSRIVNWIEDSKLLKLERSSEALMELTFDRAIKGKVFDARPTLPVIFRY